VAKKPKPLSSLAGMPIPDDFEFDDWATEEEACRFTNTIVPRREGAAASGGMSSDRTRKEKRRQRAQRVMRRELKQFRPE
jgi:hypothetical protein